MDEERASSAAAPRETRTALAFDTAVLHVRGHVLHLATRDGELDFCFDALGRLQSGHRRDDHFRVGLDAKVLWRRGAAARERGYGVLDPREADGFFASVAAELAQAQALAADGRLGIERAAHAPEGSVGEAEARAWLGRAAARGAEAYRAQAAAFRAVYRPVPILPPDCYRSVVVQLTEGCVWNRCAFCRLYRGIPYRIKHEPEIEQHLAAIVALFGPALALRAHVFLGDANALVAPEPALVFALGRIRAVLPGPSAGGVRSFVDAWSRVPDFARLAHAGLARVYLGLETGDPELLRALDKPGTPDGAIALVRAARDAGLEVGVIVLAGIGGERFAAEHVRRTLEVVRAMELGARDRVFVSPLAPPADAELPGGVLAPQALAAQQRALTHGFSATGVKSAHYALERWLY